MTVKKGDNVQIDFLDHCEGGKRALRFVACGRVVNVTKKEIVVRGWDYKKPGHKEDRNVTQWAIVLGPTTTVTKLCPTQSSASSGGRGPASSCKARGR